MFSRTLFMALSAATLAAIAPAPAHAQLGKLKDKVKSKVNEKVDAKIDCTLDKYFDKKECKEAREKAEKESDDGNASSSKDAKVAGNTERAKELKPGQGAWANFDFVPGNRPLFVDDLTRDRVGNFPKRLTLDDGTFEIVEWKGQRWLSSTTEGGFHITLPEALPERWTMEFDVTIPWWGMNVYPGKVHEGQPNMGQTQGFAFGVSGEMTNGKSTKAEFDPRNLFGPHFFETCKERCTAEDIERNAAEWDDNGASQPVRVRIHADGAYMKMYINERRVGNMPNMGKWQGNQINFYFHGHNADNTAPMISNFSIMAGGREMYDALMADGRLAVQGIYFDTGKERIRPESSGTLSEIAAVMSEHPELKLTVEGHTDNVGDAAANQKLSEARAAAVVAALQAAPYNVGAGRLKSVGLGATKPAKPNETPEGRQANRRVELVVQK